MLRVSATSGGGARRRLRVDGVSFDVRAGEIVGIAGVEGNGQTELDRSACRTRSDPARTSGAVLLNGRDVTALSVRARRELGIAHVPEDRQRRGLLLDFALAENAILGVHRRPPIAVGPRPGHASDGAAIRRRRPGILAASTCGLRIPTAPARALSGGNQQKLIVGREFALHPRLLLVSQPTRGVDIGAIEFIHRKLVALRDAGCAVLLVSAELEEVMSLADRLLVMRGGPDRRRSGSGLGETRGADRTADDGRRRGNERRCTRSLTVDPVVAVRLVGAAVRPGHRRQPVQTYRLLLGSALSWPDGIGYTLFLATPLIFTGLAVAVAFRGGLLNIGAEGQLYVAAFAAAWVGIVRTRLPSWCWCRCA